MHDRRQHPDGKYAGAQRRRRRPHRIAFYGRRSPFDGRAGGVDRIQQIHRQHQHDPSGKSGDRPEDEKAGR